VSPFQRAGQTYETAEEFFAALEADQPGPIHWWLRYGPRYLWREFRHKLREPRYGWQRARRGYSEQDVWGLFWHLSRVIAGSTRELRDTGHGHPNGTTPEEWDEILTAIADGFEAATKDHDMTEADHEALRKAQLLFAKHYLDLWD
jgi:hypothetical protein